MTPEDRGNMFLRNVSSAYKTARCHDQVEISVKFTLIFYSLASEKNRETLNQVLWPDRNSCIEVRRVIFVLYKWMYTVRPSQHNSSACSKLLYKYTNHQQLHRYSPYMCCTTDVRSTSQLLKIILPVDVTKFYKSVQLVQNLSPQHKYVYRHQDYRKNINFISGNQAEEGQNFFIKEINPFTSVWKKHIRVIICFLVY